MKIYRTEALRAETEGANRFAGSCPLDAPLPDDASPEATFAVFAARLLEQYAQDTIVGVEIRSVSVSFIFKPPAAAGGPADE